MNREIKFRAYDQFNDCFYHSEKLGMKEFWRHVSELNEAGNNVVVDRYTELKDKNGVDVYEGDICKVLYTDWPSKDSTDQRSIEQYLYDILRIGYVEFVDYEWIFNFGQSKRGGIDYGNFIVGTHGLIQRIGNVYQNPELLNP